MTDLTPDGILAELQPIFKQAMDEPELIVTPDSRAVNTPNWDSLAHIEMIELVERHFNIRFSLSELQDLRSVRDIVAYIQQKSADR